MATDQPNAVSGGEPEAVGRLEGIEAAAKRAYQLWLESDWKAHVVAVGVCTNDVPWLVAEVRRLSALVETMRREAKMSDSGAAEVLDDVRQTLLRCFQEMDRLVLDLPMQPGEPGGETADAAARALLTPIIHDAISRGWRYAEERRRELPDAEPFVRAALRAVRIVDAPQGRPKAEGQG